MQGMPLCLCIKKTMHGDDLEIMTGIVDIGERSGVCHHRIVRKDGTVIARADLTFVLLDMRANKAAAIEAEVRQALVALILPKEAFSV